MKHYLKPIAGSAAALVLAACSAGQTTPPSATSVNVTSAAVTTVQFAVGTANIGGTATGMNVLAMARQANGLSAVLVDTPKLTGPFAFTVAGVAAPDAGSYDLLGGANTASSTADQGPSTAEVSGNYIGGSPQIAFSSATASMPYTTFGTSGGLFGNGFAPANYNSNGVPNSFNPYNEPLYAGLGNQATFVPWGGPPAFDPNGNGTGTLGSTGTNQFCESLSNGACTPFPGIPMGINLFQGVTAGAGAYSLAVTIPTGTTGSGTVTATDTAAPVTLPNFTAPTIVTSVDPATTGGDDAAITYALPAGVTGAYIQVADLGPADPDSTNFLGACNGGSTWYYTAWVTSSGTFTINNAYGKNAPKGPAICGASYYAANGMTSSATNTPLPDDTLQVVAIGFDYDQYALQYSGSVKQIQKPTIPATADVTISPIEFFPNPGAAYLTSKARTGGTITRH